MIGKTRLAVGLTLVASLASGIGQTLDGKPVGHQEVKEHERPAAVPYTDPHTGKVTQPHEKIEDYDAYIKQQSGGAHHSGQSTPAP